MKTIFVNLLLTIMLVSIFGCKKDEDTPKIKDFDPYTMGDYFVSPLGSDDNPGTVDEPWLTFNKAIEMAVPGDTIYFRGGPNYNPYKMTSKIYINPSTSIGRNGTAGNYICYFNYPGESPIFDFGSMPNSGNYNAGGLIQRAGYIAFRGFTIRNVYQFRVGVEVAGLRCYDSNHIIHENITIHNVSGQAFCYYGSAGYYGIEFDSSFYINCDAHDCCDSLIIGGGTQGGFADGFKYDNELGGYILFEGCRAWNCSDDGFDPSGPGTVVFNSCWSFSNGYLDGDGTGYKTGGMRDSSAAITRKVTNCLAAYNKGTGFFLLEYNPYYRTNAEFYNNISLVNQYGFSLSNNLAKPNVLGVWKNNISYQNKLLDFTNSYQQYTESNNTWDRVDGYPGYVNSVSVTFTDADFASTFNLQELKNSRKDDGSLPYANCLRLATDSDLKGAGINVGMSEAPDIGIDWAFLDRP